MADPNDRTAGNVPGRYYVDDSCIDCDLCRETAPSVFRRNDDIGQSYVHRQPATGDEIGLAEEALAECPSDSIGNDGEGLKPVADF